MSSAYAGQHSSNPIHGANASRHDPMSSSQLQQNANSDPVNPNQNNESLPVVVVDHKLPQRFKNDAETWIAFRNHVIQTLKQKSNNFALSWRTKFDWLMVALTTVVIDNNETIKAEFCCKGCYEYVKKHTLLFTQERFASIRDIQSAKIQNPSLVAHEKASLHKKAYGLAIPPEDLNVWKVIYCEAMLNIPLRTHPFFMYLGTVAGAAYGDKLHGISSAAKITIVLGSLIRSYIFKFVEKSVWKGFGLDTGDGVDAQKLLYVFSRLVALGKPVNVFFGVRRELGAKGIDLFEMYKDMITGADLEWGYDIEIKLKKEFHQNNNDNDHEMKEANLPPNQDYAYDPEDVTHWTEPQYITLVKKLKQNHVKLGMDWNGVVSSTSSVCSDKASNFWGTDRGFEGHRVRNEKTVMEAQDKNVRTLRNHCV
eukprot:51719_1